MPDIGQFVPRPGIDQISRTSETDLPQRLPEGESSVPNGAALQLELPAVLFKPSLEQSLQESLRPELSDRSVLSPQNFQEAVAEARGRLIDLAREAEGQAAQERFEEASRVLEADRELRNLLNTNRIVLQQA